jgi:hypothetical protein
VKTAIKSSGRFLSGGLLPARIELPNRSAARDEALAVVRDLADAWLIEAGTNDVARRGAVRLTSYDAPRQASKFQRPCS